MRHLWLVKVYFYMADSTDKINFWLLHLDYNKVPWAQLNSSLHWKDTYFTSESNSGLFAKSKEGTIYYLSKLCSRSRVKLASWLLITLQSDQQGKSSVSNHLQHTSVREGMNVCLLTMSAQIPTWEVRTYSINIQCPAVKGYQQPPRNSEELFWTCRVHSHPLHWYLFFSPSWRSLWERNTAHPGLALAGHVQGGWLDPSLHNVESKKLSLTSTRSGASPGSESWRTHLKLRAFT